MNGEDEGRGTSTGKMKNFWFFLLEKKMFQQKISEKDLGEDISRITYNKQNLLKSNNFLKKKMRMKR